MSNELNPLKIKIQKMYSLPIDVVRYIAKQSKYNNIYMSEYISKLVYNEINKKKVKK
jgi:FAD synthase